MRVLGGFRLQHLRVQRKDGQRGRKLRRCIHLVSGRRRFVAEAMLSTTVTMAIGLGLTGPLSVRTEPWPPRGGDASRPSGIAGGRRYRASHPVGSLRSAAHCRINAGFTTRSKNHCRFPNVTLRRHASLYNRLCDGTAMETYESPRD